MEQSEIDAMSFDEKLAKLRKGISIPSPAEHKELQDLEAMLEKIRRINARLERAKFVTEEI